MRELQVMIEIKNLKKVYNLKRNPFYALKGVDLKIKEGESVAIIGKSGSGKSTLMHLLAALDSPSEGEVTFREKNISKMSQSKLADIRNKEFGFIFQQFFLMPNDSVLDNVALPLKIRGMKSSERKRKALKALEEVELIEFAQNKANDLSGGQKQRVAVARALVTEPKIIFADEPTGNLDTQTGETVIKLLFKLNKEKGITLILVTHDEDLAKMADRQIIIRDGLIIK